MRDVKIAPVIISGDPDLDENNLGTPIRLKATVEE